MIIVATESRDENLELEICIKFKLDLQYQSYSIGVQHPAGTKEKR